MTEEGRARFRGGAADRKDVPGEGIVLKVTRKRLARVASMAGLTLPPGVLVVTLHCIGEEEEEGKAEPK